MLVNTGNGQIAALIANVKSNLDGTGEYDNPSTVTSLFRSGYSAGYKNQSGVQQIEGDHIYAYSTGTGNLINVLGSSDGIIPNLSSQRIQKNRRFWI